MNTENLSIVFHNQVGLLQDCKAGLTLETQYISH